MIRLRACVCSLATLFCVAGCANPLDFFGVEERVVESVNQVREDDLQSDRRPNHDPSLIVAESYGGCEFLLNKSKSITRLSLQELRDEDEELDGVLFPTRAAALDRLGNRTVIPSIEVVHGALRPFVDGLYAAVELVTERGSKGALVNKRDVLDAIIAELLSRHEADPANESLNRALVDFAAAERLGGSTIALPNELEGATRDRLAEFGQDEFQSKPIGYYEWLPDLEAIYQRDRLLMLASPEPAAVSEIVDVFVARPDLQSGYASMLRSYVGFTDPTTAYTPVDVANADTSMMESGSGAQKMAAFLETHPYDGTTCSKGFHWIPPSTRPEKRLFDRLACSGAAGEGNLFEALIQAVQSGQIDLTPNKESGFFDRQLYAAETLLLPERGSESAHLLLTRAYKEKLVDKFRSVLTRTTETSAKQLFIVSPEVFELKSVHLYPRLPIEPLPTFYLRTARAYAFLQSFLTSVLGTEAMDTTPRVLEHGQAAAVSIGTELRKKIHLLYGLHILAAASIGMRPELSDNERSTIGFDDAEAEARHWLDSWKTDADVRSDPREIVPLARDEELATYWAVAGIKVVRMVADYPKGAEPDIVASFCTSRGFVPFEPYMLVEQTLQVTRPSSRPPLTQDEFRAIADQHTTLDSLREALEVAP